MALVSQGWLATITLIDSGANTSTLSYELTSADYTEATTDVGVILTALNTITDAVIKGYKVAERFVENALSLPAAGVHVENRASVVCQIAGDPTKTVTVFIPAPVIGIFQSASGSSSNVIDVDDTDLRSYIAIWHSTAEATISDGESVALSPNGGILRGVRQHRASRVG